ncbi:MAG: stage II sporulation protein M [Anaerovoracaceae bacterium]
MKRKSSGMVTSIIYGNFPLMVVVVFCFLLGISLGTFTELLLSADAKESMRQFLDFHLLLSGLTGDLLGDLFLVSAAANLSLFLIILLSGLTVVGFPAALLVLLYKGAALGFSAALLMDAFDAKGVLMVLLTLLPPNLILAPALCGAAVASLRLAFDLLSDSPLQLKKNLAQRAGPFMTFQALMAILVLLGCFIESFISPLLQRLLG